jgi:DNA-binding MarR family transcriptional regulator
MQSRPLPTLADLRTAQLTVAAGFQTIERALRDADVFDLSPVRALLLVNLGENTSTVTDLIERGYYVGSSASYNVRVLVEGGYIIETDSKHDRRVRYVAATAKGKRIAQAVRNAFPQPGSAALDEVA